MTNTTRNLVTVVMMDQDTNLPADKAVVAKFDDVVMIGDDQQGMLMNLMIDKDIKGILTSHNKMRSEIVNETVEARTGSSNVKLKDITIQDLDIQIKG